MVGQTISHYRVLRKLGEGGMGVVYQAEDTKLDRSVALKFLADHLLHDAEAKQRFLREAKSAAALQHPNICTVFEIDEVGGKTFLAMAFLEGETLEERIGQVPLPLKNALEIGRHVADGLQAAHAAGIVHRDIKPANILVSADGRATILDFGLARLAEASRLTKPDSTMGTVAYMAPEQIQGMAVDHRADIWALGCVLYEMIRGQRPFQGQYDQALAYEIVNQEPEPLTSVRADVPMELELIVAKCLAKPPEDRYGSAEEVARDLRTLGEKLKSGRSTIHRSAPSLMAPAPPAPQPEAPATNRKLRLFQGLLAVAALLALALSFPHFTETPPDSAVYEVTVEMPPDSTVHTYALSPDGRHVALALMRTEGDRELWVRSMDSRRARELSGGEGAQYPFWSPDSRHIGFFADGKLKKISLAGGPSQVLCDAPDGRGGTWNDEGVIVFAPSPYGLIRQVSDGGGSSAAVPGDPDARPQMSRRFPWFLPDGRHFLYHRGSGTAELGIYLGSLDGAEPRRLLEDDSIALYASSGDKGFILFARDRALMAQPFDARRLELDGDVFPVTESVGRTPNQSNYLISASRNGSLLYGGADTALPLAQLGWYDRSGEFLEQVGEPMYLSALRLSPDDHNVALSTFLNDNLDIWLFDLSRSAPTRFTTGPFRDSTPVWSPDGGRVAFGAQGSTGVSFYQQDTGGVREAELLLADVGPQAWLLDWSPDGRSLLFEIDNGAGGFQDLRILTVGEAGSSAYLASPFRDLTGRFSPDGRWVAYVSNESGRFEVYVRRFPVAERKWPISSQGGSTPVWSKDGRGLYYLAPDGMLMEAAVRTSDETIEVGPPEALFATDVLPRPGAGPGLYSPTYDVSRDGRFLIANVVTERRRQDLTLVLNWQARLRR